MLGRAAKGALAAVLAAAQFAVAAEPSRAIPCRNLKSATQCAAEERSRDRPGPLSPDQLAEVRTSNGAVRVEKVIVTAEPEDLPPPEKDKWERFEAHVTARPRWVEFTGNDGTRMSCVVEPPACKVNCCARLKEFNLTGSGLKP